MPRFPYIYPDLTDEPPGAGEVRVDAVDPYDASALWVDYAPTGSREAVLALTAGQLVRLEDQLDDRRYVQFTTVAPASDLGAYAYLPVGWQSAGSTVAHGWVDLVLPDPPPGAGLGATDAYAGDAELVAVIGAAAGAAAATRRAVALLLATRWVAYRIGVPVTDDPIPVGDGLTVHAVPATAAQRSATIAAAVRFYRSPDVPWGVAGGWDEAVYVRQSMPEVELILFGQRQRWGIA